MLEGVKGGIQRLSPGQRWALVDRGWKEGREKQKARKEDEEEKEKSKAALMAADKALAIQLVANWSPEEYHSSRKRKY